MTSDTTMNRFLEDHAIDARPRPGQRAASPRMRDLDFLVGHVSSVFDTGVRFDSVIRPIMGGHYIQMDLQATYADGSWRNDGRWIVGWSDVDQNFQSYYVDAMGNQGMSTSPGWVDGTLEFVGSHIVGEVGVRTMTKDHYVRVDEDHFQLTAWVQVKGEWKQFDTQNCTRTPL